MANRNEITPSETVVRISIPYLTNFIVSLPLVGMVASFITSVLFTKEQIFESECGVNLSNKIYFFIFKNLILVSKFYSIIFISNWCITR
jgi:hypothetical protein